ncbi:hypothetical protein H5410_022194 [Solanum commersonii]|uniref:Uncharacterized protein n=1 Tax=Solanum commersonii TaxID=4109 RepID=A0A9J5ZDI5_SOLCO|nr:hypothetical protein H5410_022194 [Solanum commersonii]
MSKILQISLTLLRCIVFDGVDVGGGIDAGAGVDVGGDIGAGAGQDQRATSCRRCFGFLCEKCKKQDEDSIMYLQTLSQAVNEFKNKRGGQGYSIKECSASIYCTGQEEEKILYQGNTKFEEEDLWRIVNGHRRGIARYIDEILTLMWERHVRYLEYYDSTYIILDLNFYSNFKQIYDKMSEEATTVGGKIFTQLINEFEWNEDMISYVKGH